MNQPMHDRPCAAVVRKFSIFNQLGRSSKPDSRRSWLSLAERAKTASSPCCQVAAASSKNLAAHRTVMWSRSSNPNFGHSGALDTMQSAPHRSRIETRRPAMERLHFVCPNTRQDIDVGIDSELEHPAAHPQTTCPRALPGLRRAPRMAGSRGEASCRPPERPANGSELSLLGPVTLLRMPERG